MILIDPLQMTSDPDEWYNGFDPREINNDTNGLPDFSLPVSMQVCDFLGFLDFTIFFTNLPLPQTFLERREVATKERKKYCVQTSCLWGCGESVNPPKN